MRPDRTTQECFWLAFGLLAEAASRELLCLPRTLYRLWQEYRRAK